MAIIYRKVERRAIDNIASYTAEAIISTINNACVSPYIQRVRKLY